MYHQYFVGGRSFLGTSRPILTLLSYFWCSGRSVKGSNRGLVYQVHEFSPCLVMIGPGNLFAVT